MLDFVAILEQHLVVETDRKAVDRELERNSRETRDPPVKARADDRPRLVVETMELCGEARHAE